MRLDDRPPPQTADSRYRLLVESITDYAIYMLDPNGLVTSWNAGAERFKGYRPDEIIGENFSRFYAPDDVASGLPAKGLATAAREGRFESEGWRVRKDGARFWAHVVIDAIRSDHGELLGFAKITRDLTERRLAQEALRSSEEQFRLLVQSVTDYAIYMLDASGHVSNWNAGAKRIKQYTADEIVGAHFSRFYTEEDRASGMPARALEIAATQGRFESEGWRVRKDGARFWANVVIDPIYDEGGKVIAFAKITRDITERRETQKALDEAREALFQSQKMDAIGQLTGGVAHDFNNLLMAVLGSLELLRKRLPADDARANALLDNAVHGAERGATLTQRMLSFARKQELTLEPIHVPTLVDGMAGLLARSLGPSIRITTQFADDLPAALSDPNQLEMGLLNLAINARDAMPAGGEILVEAQAVTVVAGEDIGLPAGPFVLLTITDNGAGMNSDTLARATEPFYTTKGVGKGTGLGLSMVHGLAEQSGGRLRLVSAPGEGTRAELWLPAGTFVARGAPYSPVRPQALKSAEPLVVLVVDDDALVLLNTVAMLEDLGHRAVAAGSASEALELLTDTRFDLVISDYAMPGMTGLQLIDQIRRDVPEAAVALATGYAELPPGHGSDVPRLAKPYGQADLIRLIHAVRCLQSAPNSLA